MLIEGEPGIGKSALISAATTAVAADLDAPLDVVWVESADLPGRVPQSLTDWTTRPAAATRQERRNNAATVMSDLTEQGPVGTAEEAMQRSAKRIWAGEPVAIVFENLQDADEAALALWRRLIATTRHVPLVLIGTRRPVPVCAALDRQRRELAEAGDLVLDLGPLTEPYVADLAGTLTGARPGARFAEALAAAAGNPRYVRELVRAGVRSGAVQITGGVADLHPDASALPTAWVENRLGFLRPETLSALRGAALLDPAFSAADLSLVTGHTPADLIPAVDEALAAGLLQPAGSLLRFRHPVIQAGLHAVTAPKDRTAILKRVARTLIASGANPHRIVRLLRSTQSARSEPWAADWLAEHAAFLARHMPADAAELFARAVSDLETDDHRRAVLEDALAAVNVQLLRLDKGIRLAGTIAQRSNDPERVARNTFLLGLGLGMKLDGAAEMVRVLRDAAVRPEISKVWRARLDALRADGYVMCGLYPQARQLAEQALAEGLRLDDPTTLGHALHARAVVAAVADRDTRAGATALEQALAATRAVPGLEGLHLCLWAGHLNLGFEIGTPAEELMDSAQRVLAAAAAATTPYRGRLRMDLADLTYELGLWDEAAAALEPEDVLLIPYVRQAVGARIAARRDRWSEAANKLTPLRGFTAEPGNSRRLIVYRHILATRALTCERNGSAREAMTVLAEFLEPGAEYRYPQRYRFLPALTRYALAAGDLAAAAAAARAAAADCHDEALIGKRAADAWCRGLVHDDPDAIDSAAILLRRSGARSDLGNAWEDAAVLHAQAGDAVRAHRALTDALEVYVELGAAWDARRATARLRAHGIRIAARGRGRQERHGLHALTAAELRVAELVADGYSNPDIADQLNVSPRTVEGHVSRVLAKLGVDSRYKVSSHLAPQRAAGP